jgi:hypothetical protein
MRPNFFQRLRYLLGLTSDDANGRSRVPPATPNRSPLHSDNAPKRDRVTYRDVFDDKSPAKTIREIHAVLNEAIEKGHGDRPVFIKLESIEGQLCGRPLAHVSSIETDLSVYVGTEGYCALVPHMSLVHVSHDTFREIKMRNTFSLYD